MDISQASSDGVYIITFEEAGLLHYNGSVNGIMSTAPRANSKLNVKSAAAQAYQGYLASQRHSHVTEINNALRRDLDVTHNYAITRNGIAAYLTASEAATVAAMPGIKNVRKAGVEHLDTYRGPTFIGADTIWNGANTPSSVGTRGKGIRVGILDSGANSTHPSFANDTSCDFRPSMPKLTAVDCSATDVNGFCNGPDPEAAQGNGHGVHTASTVAGNTIDNNATPAPLLPDGFSMSGVAPCAAIVSYKVCQTDSCGSADIEAGIENAIADGVDVINFSISGGRSPWNDNDRAFLDAVDAGIFVAASAGNTRAEIPNPVGQVAHLGPWMLTVAASTQDELIGPELAVTGPDALPAPPPDLAHVSLNPGSSTIVAETADFVGKTMLSYPTNIEGCTAFPANYFDDAIALVRRGSCAFADKVTNAFNAGAAMVIIGNNAAGVLNMNTDGAPDVPNFSVTQEDGDALIAYAAGNNPPAPPEEQIFADGFEEVQTYGAIADYNRTVLSTRQGDVLADFSLRGPTSGSYADETKPDITGPGVDIYAALTTAEGSYGYESGTSMSSPHLAGAAALMRAARPNWTVTEIKSAMMTTATNANGMQEDGLTPWNIDDVGGGRIDLTKAALAGLTMNETYANFVAANPAASGDIRTLNLPALRDVNCESDCTWTREFKNQLPASGTWDVSFVTDAGFSMAATPATFTLAPGATQSVEFTASPVGDQQSIVFGEAILTEQAALSPAQHLTIAVKSPEPPVPPGVCDGGVCNLQVDGLVSSFSAVGCGPTEPCQYLWLNRFTPDPAEYPITLNTVRTVAPASGTAVGDLYDVYVYQDNDNDPANGAVLVGSVLNVPVIQVNAFLTIPLPGGFVMNGPGDILVALVNRTVNARPSAADSGVAFAGRSYIGDDGVIPVSPDLADMGLVLLSELGIEANWIIRAQGTNAGGRPITLAPSDQ